MTAETLRREFADELRAIEQRRKEIERARRVAAKEYDDRLAELDRAEAKLRATQPKLEAAYAALSEGEHEGEAVLRKTPRKPARGRTTRRRARSGMLPRGEARQRVERVLREHGAVEGARSLAIAAEVPHGSITGVLDALRRDGLVSIASNGATRAKMIAWTGPPLAETNGNAA